MTDQNKTEAQTAAEASAKVLDTAAKTSEKVAETSKKAVNKHMAWGTEFEATARIAYECETGLLVQETGFWIHPSLPWLGASPDGLVGPVGLCEIKCPSVLPVAVPVHHRIQMIVQLACTGRKWADYFVWTHDGQFLQRVFPSGAEGIIRKLQAFYEAYVLTNQEPPRKKRKPKEKQQ